MILLLFCSACPPPISARTWYVKADATGDAPTIQAGIDSAAAGDTVLVAAGVYTDATERLVSGTPRLVNVHVSKNVVLTAEGSPENTVIDGMNGDIAVYAEGVDSTAAIIGFRIRTQTEGYACIVLDEMRQGQSQLVGVGIWCDATAVVIRGNTFSNNRTGVYLSESRATVHENTIFDCLTGISCNNQSDASITGNSLSDCASLIDVYDSSPTVSDNDLWSNRNIVCAGLSVVNSSAIISNNRISGMDVWAIHCAGGSPAIEDNLIDNCGYAVFLLGTMNAHVRRNLVVSDATAVEVTYGTGAVVENNTIQQAVVGVLLDQTGSPVVAKNIIEKCTYGIECYLPISPAITCNDVYDCDKSYSGQCPDRTGVGGNFSLDPEYCGIDGSGNYFLQRDSPCAPGNHPDGYDCGLIGAYEVNCGEVKASEKSWGAIKSLYRKAGEDRD
ncbi:MAG: right-handed parallel beta-helix repeat-containing protein [bacterium]